MSTTTENLYVGDGSTVLYSFTFPYIEEADVKVSLNQLDTTDFTLANATTVEFNTAPGSGVSIRIYRETTVDSLYAEFYPGSAIRAQDLNGNFEQTLFVVQESQAVIENSDAATVVGIANQALTTANQAESTANAISGTANQALTNSSSALTTANTAATDATTAQNTATAAQSAATAAQTTADNAIGVDEGLGAAVEDVLIWSGSAWVPGPQTGTGGGGTTYDNASAWGNVASDGTLNNGLNIDSVTRVSVGLYTVAFATPMPSADYAVVGAALTNSGLTNWQAYNILSTGFDCLVTSQSGGLSDDDFSFAVHATNALPPAGGTGTDAWGTCQGTGTIDASFNVASVTRTSTGTYDVVFTTPMPTSKYAVTCTVNSDDSRYIRIVSKAASSFTVDLYNGSNVLTDASFAFSVNATNATLPSTFTVAQFNDLVARVTALENP